MHGFSGDVAFRLGRMITKCRKDRGYKEKTMRNAKITCLLLLFPLLACCQKSDDTSAQNSENATTLSNFDASAIQKKPYKPLQSDFVDGIYYIPSYDAYMNPKIEQSTSEHAIYGVNEEKITYSISLFESANRATTIRDTTAFPMDDGPSVSVRENTGIMIMSFSPYFYRDDFCLPCKIQEESETGYISMKDICLL